MIANGRNKVENEGEVDRAVKLMFQCYVGKQESAEAKVWAFQPFWFLLNLRFEMKEISEVILAGLLRGNE